VLYVSPLKALNTDVRENLMLPLTEIRERFHAEGASFPAVRPWVRLFLLPLAELSDCSVVFDHSCDFLL
jgi:ATP-dependent Lhr-like helicase